MSNLRNNVRLIGRLGFDPELKEFESGNKQSRMSIATSRYYVDAVGNRVEETQWHNVVAWGKLAELSSRMLKKGCEVAVEGKITSRNYVDKQGIKRYVTEIVIDELLLIDKHD